jgi:hypothetical protein
MQDKSLPHIGLTFPENFPDQIIERYKTELSADGLDLQIRKISFGGPYASIEWAIPTLIGVYILKPYFDGFLKEMAKDHYIILKNWLKKISSETRDIKITTFAAGQSKDKLDNSNSQSKIFSIQSQTNQEQQIKFLFDEKFSSEVWNFGIDNAIALLDNNFINGLSDELTIEIKNGNLEKTIYARLKNDKGEWEFLDFKKLVQEKINEQTK